MAWNRARECCEKYTRGTKIVAEFLKTEGEHSGCLVTDPEPDDNHHSYVLSLPNFIHIAEHLATQSAFSVPTHIMGALDEVIKLRSECNRIHEELGTGGTAADERHKHAIDVFQDVRKILLPKSSSGTVGSGDEIRGLSDTNDPHATRDPASLATFTLKFSSLWDGLKRMREFVQRYWSRNKEQSRHQPLF